MAKIGIYVFTNKIKKRGTRKSHFFDSDEYSGLKYIVSEIDRDKHEVEYCSISNINDFDFTLVTVISFYDVLNLVSELKGRKIKSKIIVGGPGVFNIRTYKKYIDIAIFRRGEGIINQVFECKPLPNVWYKIYDEDLKTKYEIGIAKQFINDEKSIGCQNKCYFCQYSWTNKYISRNEGDEYSSGYNDYEDFFMTLDWEKAKKTAVSALDASTEYGRKKINKPINNVEIIEKILESNKVESEKRLSLKIYNIIGYEWEDESVKELIELKEIFKEVSYKLNNKIIIMMHFSHFIPMQHTPLWYLPIDMYNYRDYYRKKPLIIDDEKIKVYVDSYGTTPAYAIEECIIERGYEEHAWILENILSSSKYKNMSVKEKMLLFEKQEFDFAIKKYNKTDNYPTDYMISNFQK